MSFLLSTDRRADSRAFCRPGFCLTEFDRIHAGFLLASHKAKTILQKSDSFSWMRWANVDGLVPFLRKTVEERDAERSKTPRKVQAATIDEIDIQNVLEHNRALDLVWHSGTRVVVWGGITFALCMMPSSLMVIPAFLSGGRVAVHTFNIFNCLERMEQAQRKREQMLQGLSLEITESFDRYFQDPEVRAEYLAHLQTLVMTTNAAGIQRLKDKPDQKQELSDAATKVIDILCGGFLFSEVAQSVGWASERNDLVADLKEALIQYFELYDQV